MKFSWNLTVERRLELFGLESEIVHLQARVQTQLKSTSQQNQTQNNQRWIKLKSFWKSVQSDSLEKFGH